MGEPFWARLGLSTKPMYCWVLGAVAVGAIVASVAATAQSAAATGGRANGIASTYMYPFAAHVTAMTAVAALAVVLAVTLWRSASRLMALAVLGGAAAGPMAVVAAPIRPWLVAPTSMDTLWWWHLLVASALTLVLGGWALAIQAVERKENLNRTRRMAGRWEGAAFVVVTALAFTLVWNHAWQLQESPGALPAAGWSLISAGAVIATARATWLRAGSILVLSALSLWALSYAYTRTGGWPGVAGWEMNGMESPVVLSGRVGVVLMTSGAAGLVTGIGRHLLARTRPSAGRRPNAPVADPGVA